MSESQDVLEDLLKELEDGGTPPEDTNPPLVPPSVPVADMVAPAAMAVVQPRNEGLDIATELAEHQTQSRKLLAQIDDDRKQIAEVIKLYFDRVSDPTAKAAYVEQLAALMKAQVDTSNNAVRVLDSRTRLLQTFKPSAGINIQNIAAGSGAELMDILSAPSGPDEDV